MSRNIKANCIQVTVNEYHMILFTLIMAINRIQFISNSTISKSTGTSKNIFKDLIFIHGQTVTYLLLHEIDVWIETLTLKWTIIIYTLNQKYKIKQVFLLRAIM